MTPRSVRHHQVPVWHLKHFSWKSGKKEMLWVGSKDPLTIRPSSVDETFFRNNANTRTDYQSQADGDPNPQKSDKDEKILADFDSKAAPAARQLISFARKWRDTREAAAELSLVDLETCKNIIVGQARRAWEAQDRAGLGEDKSELYLDLLFQRAEEQGQQLPSREDLLRNQLVTGRFNVLSQNHRATFASADHPILAVKETEFLAPLGLSIVVIENPTREFIIGSHGTTIVETAQGKTAWLPVAPDVAISLSDRPGTINIGICTDEFVELHNTAALALSAQVTGHSKEVIQELLGARTDSAASVRSIDR